MEFKDFVELSKTLGPLGTLFLYFLWERVINPSRKKRKGTFITWQEMKKKQDEYVEEVKKLSKETAELKEKLESQINRSIEKGAKIEALEAKQTILDRVQQETNYFLRDVAGNMKTNNRLLGDIKDYLDRVKGENP